MFMRIIRLVIVVNVDGFTGPTEQVALAIVNGVQMLYASSINIGKECHSEVKLF